MIIPELKQFSGPLLVGERRKAEILPGFPARIPVTSQGVRGVCSRGGKGTELVFSRCLMEFSKLELIIILFVGLMLALHCTDSSFKALHEISWIETGFKRGCRHTSEIPSLGEARCICRHSFQLVFSLVTLQCGYFL